MRVIYYERWFILLTSVLVFVLPIIAFQFILPASKKSIQKSKQEEIEKEQVTTTKSTMVVRIVKLVFLNALQVFPYSKGILLLTVTFREDNKRIDGGIPCNTIHGWDAIPGGVTDAWCLSHTW